jgi:hypothetical protein
MNQPSLRGTVDFGTLSSQLRILRTTPAWEVVRESISRLKRFEQQKGEKQVRESDVQAVHDFANLLEEERHTMALALLCGAVLGQALPEEAVRGPGERLMTGLRTLSAAFRFKEKSGPELHYDLEWLSDEIEKALSFHPKAHIPLYSPRRDLSEFKSSLLEGITAARSLAIHVGDEERRAAWNDASRRINDFMINVPPQRPSLNEMLASVSGVSPGSLLAFDLMSMTIQQWSLAFALATMETAASDRFFAPGWLAAPSLKALSFSFDNHARLDQWLVSKEVRKSRPLSTVGSEVIYSWPWLMSTAAERAVLIVCDSPMSMTANWKPSPRSAALSVTPSDLAEIIKRGFFKPESYPAHPTFHVLAVEEIPENRPPTGGLSPWAELVEKKVISESSGQLDGNVQLGTERPQVIRFFRDRPKSPPPGDYVVGPQTVEDLFPVGLGPQLAR